MTSVNETGPTADDLQLALTLERRAHQITRELLAQLTHQLALTGYIVEKHAAEKENTPNDAD